MKEYIIIIGAGPAGLTAGYEILEKTDYIPIIFEADDIIGGISRTVNHNGNRMDIGGHRFFSKSDKVMDWWMNILPLAENSDDVETISYHNNQRTIEKDNRQSEDSDKVFLVRPRLSRIFYKRHFFDYPLSLNFKTFANLGLISIIKIGFSYLKSSLLPIKDEKTLEDFLINRFGYELYATFFRDYTEKVWGVPCDSITADWGRQRIKGLSITKAILNAFGRIFKRDKSIRQKNTETSLIEQFLYPKLGPGQLWEEVAERIIQKGGKIYLNHRVIKLERNNFTITGVEAVNSKTGEKVKQAGSHFLSTMPVRHLVSSLDDIPKEIKDIASGLMYRDFITVGILLKKVYNPDGEKTELLPDTWIYIQEPDVKMGRIQIFNNWSPYLVKDPQTVWLGLEYFCNDKDELWQMKDNEMSSFAMKELEKLGFAEENDMLDSRVLHMPKTYPGYFGSYERFDEISRYFNRFANLFLVGRNGMHKYNNQDHSMLTAMEAVNNIKNSETSKENIWAVNTEEEYQETKNG